jgi:hypothetical protein
LAIGPYALEDIWAKIRRSKGGDVTIKRVLTALAMCFIGVLSACDSKTLTRGKAQSLIEAYPKFTNATAIPVTERGTFNADVKEGLWIMKGGAGSLQERRDHISKAQHGAK